MERNKVKHWNNPSPKSNFVPSFLPWLTLNLWAVQRDDSDLAHSNSSQPLLPLTLFPLLPHVLSVGCTSSWECSSSTMILPRLHYAYLPHCGHRLQGKLCSAISSTLLPSLWCSLFCFSPFPLLLCLLIIHYPFLKMFSQRLHHLGFSSRTQVLDSQRCFFRTLMHDKKGNYIPQIIGKKHCGMYKCAKHSAY